MFTRNREGFTLIEMLTVIGIICLLAALIFPVVISSKNQAKKAQCMSNLNQIFLALKQFQLDEHRYPDLLAGTAEWDNGGTIDYEGSGTPVDLQKNDGMVKGQLVALYPEYIKSVKGLQCPLYLLNQDKVEYGTLPDWGTNVNIIEDPMFGLGLRSWKDGNTDKPYFLHKYSSYDYQRPRYSPDGVPNSYQVHYSPRWSNAVVTTPGIDRQLRWKAPPENTLITWCTFHRDVAGNGTPKSHSRDIVLFLDGHAVQRPTAEYFVWTTAWSVIPPP